MAIQRLDNVLIVVEDLDEVIAFFELLGMELEGRGPIEGEWVEQIIGLTGVTQEVAMLRTPDGLNGVELAQFHTPDAVRYGPVEEPANTLGLRRIMFVVDDIDRVVAQALESGRKLVGEVVDYEGVYRLCYIRGPEGIVVGLAQALA